MIIIKELKKIACLNSKIDRIVSKVEEKIDTGGLDFNHSRLISGCKEKNGHLYQGNEQLDDCGIIDDMYYYREYAGYYVNDFYGILYFKTDVPGQFVEVPTVKW